MSNQAVEPGTPEAHVQARRERILDALDHKPTIVTADAKALTNEQVRHLVRDAEELYWNELAWEEITSEERVSGGHLTELVFPGFLAFVDGLLLETTPKNFVGTAKAHPSVVEMILVFLAERYAESSDKLEGGADSEELVWSRAMTARLIDLVLYRLYRLTADERDMIDNTD